MAGVTLPRARNSSHEVSEEVQTVAAPGAALALSVSSRGSAGGRSPHGLPLRRSLGVRRSFVSRRLDSWLGSLLARVALRGPLPPFGTLPEFWSYRRFPGKVGPHQRRI